MTENISIFSIQAPILTLTSTHFLDLLFLIWIERCLINNVSGFSVLVFQLRVLSRNLILFW